MNVFSLKFNDVLCIEVSTLVDEYKPDGSYKVEWNAGEFPSGIYFYQLRTDGLVKTKKMLLIK